MRSILVLLYLVIFGIFSLPLYLIFAIVGIFNGRAKKVISQKVVNGAFHVIFFISGVKVTVKGRENVLKNESAMYAFNHRGFFDILVGYTNAPAPTAFVSKDSLKKVPMISWWMMYMDCLFLDRKDIRKGMATINEGIELLKNGTSVFIAPEGTRNKGEGLLEFHAASFKLADKSKRPIIPVVLNNTDAILEQHLPWIKKGHVIIEFCEPIYMDQMEKAEKKKIGKMVREIILEKYEINQKEV